MIDECQRSHGFGNGYRPWANAGIVAALHLYLGFFPLPGHGILLFIDL